jgi:hypothetical protein
MRALLVPCGLRILPVTVCQNARVAAGTRPISPQSSRLAAVLADCHYLARLIYSAFDDAATPSPSPLLQASWC